MSKCIRECRDKALVFEEVKGRNVRFVNPNQEKLERGDVDGCLIQGDCERCDYFVRNDGTIWLIELKGADVGKAISQIISTAGVLQKEIGPREIVPVIVTTACPASAHLQKHLLKFKSCKGKVSKNIIVRTRHALIDVSAR